jgi:uncharacterized protein YcfL
MKTWKSAAAVLPVLALLGACGGGQEIVTTNSGSVVLNDAQANMTFTNDEPANATGAGLAEVNGAAMMNDSAMMNEANAAMPMNGM